MGYLKLEATVCGAITIRDGQPAGSHVDSAGYIPGSTLRGAFAGLWKKDDKEIEKFLDLFCRGNIRFHGLFPVPSKNHAKFYGNNWYPYRTPLSAFECKYDQGFINEGGHDIYDNAVLTRKRQCPVCKAPLKQTRSFEFYYWDGSEKAIHSGKEIYIYHGTERSTRRAEDAALYSYESYYDGETFVGWLSGSDEEIRNLKEYLSDVAGTGNGDTSLRLNVGRGRKRRGYLNVLIKGPAEGLSPFPEPEIVQDGRLVVVLQTPAILYDNLFRSKATVDTSDIFKDCPEGVNIQKNNEVPDHSSLVLINGWSGIQGLPRMPEKALAAGSTFVFSHDPATDEETKRTLKQYFIKVQDRGIGERRNEGLGQIIINPPLNCRDAGR